MKVFDEFMLTIDSEVVCKKDYISLLSKKLNELGEIYGSLSVTTRNNNKYYYLKRKVNNRLISMYIGKDLSNEEINSYLAINHQIKLLKKKKKLEENKLSVLLEMQKKYRRILVI